MSSTPDFTHLLRQDLVEYFAADPFDMPDEMAQAHANALLGHIVASSQQLCAILGVDYDNVTSPPCTVELGYCVCALPDGHDGQHTCKDCGAWPTGPADPVDRPDPWSHIGPPWDALIEASSLGTPAAKAFRESVTEEEAQRIVERAEAVTSAAQQGVYLTGDAAILAWADSVNTGAYYRNHLAADFVNIIRDFADQDIEVLADRLVRHVIAHPLGENS